jgi:hypothetical protein
MRRVSNHDSRREKSIGELQKPAIDGYNFAFCEPFHGVTVLSAFPPIVLQNSIGFCGGAEF